jgi:hypothetical protein
MKLGEKCSVGSEFFLELMGEFPRNQGASCNPFDSPQWGCYTKIKIYYLELVF